MEHAHSAVRAHLCINIRQARRRGVVVTRVYVFSSFLYVPQSWCQPSIEWTRIAVAYKG